MLDISASLQSAINQQINLELYGSHLYLGLAYHFDRTSIALPNISKWFRRQSEEERCHAILFMNYLNCRGGHIVLEQIQSPHNSDWESALQAFEAAFLLEKHNNQSLLSVHTLAADNNDSETCAFLEETFLTKQVDLLEQISKFIMSVTPKIFRECEFLHDEKFKKANSVEQVKKFIAHLKRIGKGIGEFFFDEELDINVQCICEQQPETN